MKDEIKEILEGIEVVIKHDGTLEFNAKELKILLDYITNLQQKYEEADNDRHKLFEQKEKAIEYINKLLKTDDIPLTDVILTTIKEKLGGDEE